MYLILMYMKSRSLLFLYITFCCSVLSAQIPNYKEYINADQLLNQLKQVSAKTTSISADFKEVKYLTVLNEPQISNGVFYYSQEDKMRWEQKQPLEYIFIMNGKSLKIRDDGEEKDLGSSNVIASKINKFTLSLIKGDYQNDKNFDAKCYESNNDYLVELIPKTKSLSKVYRTIKLHFSKDDYRLQQIDFDEPTDDKKVLIFTNQAYNEKLSDQLFTKF